MRVKLRYVTERRNANGKSRWYWDRKGHPLCRLPDDPVKRFARAEQLNAQADRAAAGVQVVAEGSIAWVINKYKESKSYGKLSAGTLKYYNRLLDDICELGPGLPFEVFDRRMVLDFIETYEGIGDDRKVAAVLRNLFKTAQYWRIVPDNHATNLDLSAPAARERIWSEEEIAVWLEAAGSHPRAEAMITAFHLLHYFAQRPIDMLKMGWSHLRSGAALVRQQKTNTLVEVPCHSALAAHLENLRPTATTIVAYNSKSMSYPAFNAAFREILAKAGLADSGLQARDLRRTACVRMAEAGATETQISAVSGHNIQTTRQILETYLPRTGAMARAAIKKWEKAERRRNKKV
ncbi:phage integrase family protein [Azospirillum brasilense]|nr:phage integrase family protein [Azospirillum brasilense]